MPKEVIARVFAGLLILAAAGSAADSYAWPVHVVSADDYGSIYDIAVDSNDDVVLCGSLEGALHVTKRRRSDGSEIWTSPVVVPIGYSDDGVKCVSGSDGTIFVMTTINALYALSGVDGSQLWVYSFGASSFTFAPVALTIHPSGDPIAAGQGDPDDVVVRFNRATGLPIWSYPIYSQPFTLAIAPDGTVYTAGAGSGGSGVNIVKVDGESGVESWNSDLPPEIGTFHGPDGLAANPVGGGVVAIARGHVAGFSTLRLLVAAWSSTGDLTWSDHFGPPNSGTAHEHGSEGLRVPLVLIDSQGNVVVGANEHDQDPGEIYKWRVRKYSSGGTLLWNEVVLGAFDAGPTGFYDNRLYSMIADTTDNVFLAGMLHNATDHREFSVAKLSPSGTALWKRSIGSPEFGSPRAYVVKVDSVGRVIAAGKQFFDNPAPNYDPLNAFAIKLWASDGSNYDCGNLLPHPEKQCDNGTANGTDNCCSAECQLVDGDDDQACDRDDNCPSPTCNDAVRTVCTTDLDCVAIGASSCISSYNPDQRNTDEPGETGSARGDVCDVCPADPGDTCVPGAAGGGTIDADGGSITTSDGHSVTFPPGALADPTSIAITGGYAGSSYGLGNTSTNLFGGVSEFGPEGILFNHDVEMVIPWADANSDGIVDGTTKEEGSAFAWRNGKKLGTCSNFPGVLCTVGPADCPPGTTCASTLPACPSGGTCNGRTCTQQGCPVGAALCCDATANQWRMKVRQFSEYALGVDPCIGTDKPKLTLTKLHTPPGDDKMTFKGTFTLPVGTTLANLDPLAHGLTLVLADAPHVLSETTLGAGAFGSGAEGWKVNGTSTKWTYVNKGPTPPNGIVKAVIQDKSNKAPGLVSFVFSAKGGDYAASPQVEADLVFPGTGQCFAAVFPGPAPSPACVLNGAGSTLKCK